MFAKLTPSQLAVVAESLVPLTFEGGDVIITKGETGDCFYMVRAGEAVVSDGGRELARIGAGGSFGERALLKDEVRAAPRSSASSKRRAAAVQCLFASRFSTAPSDASLFLPFCSARCCARWRCLPS